MKTLLLSIFLCITSILSLNAQNFNFVWQTDTILKTPESVMYDSKQKQIYVSNINGNPTEKDNNGFISLLNIDGSIKSLDWINGMDAPKGMALNDNLLYVTDIDRIHIIDITEAKIIETIKVIGASFLNDIAIIDDNKFIITDTRNNLLYILENDTVSVWLENDLLISPNGIAYFNEMLYVGTKNNLLKIDPSNKKIEIEKNEVGPIDGLIPISKDSFIVSDWSGKISFIKPDGIEILQNTSEDKIQAADLGFITNSNIILIPTFFNDRVVAVKFLN